MRITIAWPIMLSLACPANAQLAQTGAGLGTPTAAVIYSGPGNVVSGAVAFWGLRAYTAAYAAGLNKLANVCLPADSVCADATSDVNGNLVLPGSLSTCANSVVICTIKTVYDQSGALACSGGNACDVTQATIGSRATLVIPGAANGCPNTGAYCMAFVRASSQGYLSPFLLTRAQPFTGIFVGIRTGNTSSSQSVFEIPAGADRLGWNVATNQLVINAGTVQTASATDNAWHSVQGIYSNTVGSLSVDGVTTAGNNGATAPSSANISLGTTAARQIDGKLVQAGIWPGAFSAGNISAMNSNDHSYWGF